MRLLRLSSPIDFMWLVFVGFGLGLAYGIAGALLVYGVSGRTEAQHFLELYIGSFNMVVTLGLGFATALLIGASQRVVPSTIEAAFTHDELSTTEYPGNKRRLFSLARTLTFGTELIVIGLVVLQFCQLPFSGAAEAVMLVAMCLQIGLASYVGRKIRYIAMMIHSLLRVPVSRNLFRDHELDAINTYVQMVSVLAVVGVYIGMRTYFGAPFKYESFIGDSAKVFLILPAIIATPVLLIFNFYPREVLRKLYDKSIDLEIKKLQEELNKDTLSEFEKKLRLMQVEKMYRDELRYSLQLALSDLPIGITILIMVLEPLIKH